MTAARRSIALAAVAALALALLLPTGASAAPTASLTVTVTGPSSEPIPNVRVQLNGNLAGYTVVTDAAGQASFLVEPDTYRMAFQTFLATTGNYVPEAYDNLPSTELGTSFALVAGPNTPIAAQLAVGAAITGTLVGNDGGTPLVVYLQKLVSGVWKQYTLATTNAAGNYTLRGLAPGDYIIRETGPSFQYAQEYYPDFRDQANAQVFTVTGTETINLPTADVLTVAGPAFVNRIAGGDRFSTSAAVWDDYPDNRGGTVYIASGRNFPDALGAGPAAAIHNDPLMLVDTNAIPPAVLAQLTRLAPTDIVIVGGLGTVSQDVEDDLAEIAEVERIEGTDRYDTSRKLIESAFDFVASTSWLFIATGANFPDALSAGPAASSYLNSPVLLVDGSASTADAATLQLIDEIGPNNVAIVGSAGSVSAGIMQSIQTAGYGVNRYAGVDRYSTSLELNKAFYPTYGTAYLATGVTFADALAGAARAGADVQPLFVVPTDCVPLLDLQDMNDSGISNINLLGGPTTLTPRVEALNRC